MFDMLDRPLVWIPITWPGIVPGGKDGSEVAEAVEHTIEMQVELKEADEIKLLANPDEEQAKTPKVDAVMMFATGWRKIVSRGAALEFNAANVGALIQNQLPFFDAFRMAYVNAMLGRVETREGNFGGSPSDGPAAGAASGTTAKPRRKRTANGSD